MKRFFTKIILAVSLIAVLDLLGTVGIVTNYFFDGFINYLYAVYFVTFLLGSLLLMEGKGKIYLLACLLLVSTYNFIYELTLFIPVRTYDLILKSSLAVIGLILIIVCTKQLVNKDNFNEVLAAVGGIIGAVIYFGLVKLHVYTNLTIVHDQGINSLVILMIHMLVGAILFGRISYLLGVGRKK